MTARVTHPHRPAAITAAVAGLLTIAACGGGDGTSDDRTDSGAAGDGLTPVTIAAQPIVDSAPMFLGLEMGFFEEEGFDLTIETGAGGAAIVPSVISGEYEFGRGNLLSTMIAVQQGLDLTCIANANSVGDPDFSGILVMDDSPIQRPADLEGMTVSSNTLNNIGDAAVRNAVEADGGDPATVEFVELGFAEVPAALEAGHVDAAFVVEPFLTEALDIGAVRLSDAFAGIHPDLDVSCVFTTTQRTQDDPEAVEAFARAVDRSLEYAEDNPDEVRRITGTFTEIDEDTLDRMILPRFTPEMSREAAETLAERAVEFGTLTEMPDLDTLLP